MVDLRKKKAMPITSSSLRNAIERAQDINDATFSDLHKKIQEERQEVRNYFDETQESIRRGARRSAARFRL